MQCFPAPGATILAFFYTAKRKKKKENSSPKASVVDSYFLFSVFKRPRRSDGRFPKEAKHIKEKELVSQNNKPAKSKHPERPRAIIVSFVPACGRCVILIGGESSPRPPTTTGPEPACINNEGARLLPRRLGILVDARGRLGEGN